MASDPMSSALRGLGAAAFALAAALGPAAAAIYTAQQGDAVEVSVAGFPELKTRVIVQPDGAISLPLAGALKVEGMTPAELRLEVRRQLGGKIYRIHGSDGKEILAVVEALEVSAEIVGYRPIYVTGDVAHSGEQVFRPQITARQAVALAGGLGRPPARGYVRDIAAIESEYRIARLDVARNALHVARLTAELEGRSELAPPDLASLNLPKDLIDPLQTESQRILERIVADHAREGAFLRASIEQTAERIAVVEKQRTQEEEGSRADLAELQRIVELLSNGQVTNPRLTEARRALLLSSTRSLQVNVELLELKRQRAEAERNLQKLDDNHRVAWLKEREDAAAARMNAAIHAQALEHEIADAGRSRPNDAGPAPKPTLLVFRQEGARVNKMAADEDFELMPGDTVEVSFGVAAEASASR